MFRLSLLAVIMAVAQAFAPASLPAGRVALRTSAVSCMKMQAKSAAIPFLDRPPALDGKTPGDPLWVSSMLLDKGWYPFLQEAEIKHGRVAMLAAAGAIAQDMRMMTRYNSSFGNVETAPILHPAAIVERFRSQGLGNAESADDEVEEDDEAKPAKSKGKAKGKGAPQEAAAAVAVDAEVALDKAFETIAAGRRLYALAAAQKEAERAAMEVDEMSDIWR